MTVMAQIQDHITQAKNPAILQEILEWRQAEYPRAQIHAFYPEFFGMVFVEKMNGDVRVSLFSNKRKKADFCFFADSLQKANHSINVWRTENERKLKRKQEAKVQSMLKKVQAPKACELVKVGDLFAVSYGYEETTNKLYQLVELKGKTMGVFRWVRGVRAKDDFIGDEILTKKINVAKNGGHWQVFFRYESFANAYKI